MQNLKVLYVEDNPTLLYKAGELLKKFFSHIDLALDGEKGLELFKKQHHSIVITGINMPKMDGLTMAQQMQTLAPQTKIIIVSASTDKQMLVKSIELGVFRFLEKPLNPKELSHALNEVVAEIKHELHTKLFQTHLKHIFKHQSALIILLHDNKIVLANEPFLNFFHCQSLSECHENIVSLEEQFLAHPQFLYNHENIKALDVLQENPQKPYNVKMKNSDAQTLHFIVKYQSIPEQEHYGILSFDDVTQMNFLTHFTNEHNIQEEAITDSKLLFEYLDLLSRNHADIQLYNFYKGLSISNKANIMQTNDDSITITTNYYQQKAMQIEGNVLIVSEALPHSIKANTIEHISFEQQSVTLSSLHFVKTSPVTRKTIRVVPQKEQHVSLFIEDAVFSEKLLVEDISLDAVKLKFNLLPPGLHTGKKVRLEIVLEQNKQAFTINADAEVLRKQEFEESFSVVFMFQSFKKSDLVTYITKRQMALIREIKGLRNE